MYAGPRPDYFFSSLSAEALNSAVALATWGKLHAKAHLRPACELQLPFSTTARQEPRPHVAIANTHSPFSTQNSVVRLPSLPHSPSHRLRPARGAVELLEQVGPTLVVAAAHHFGLLAECFPATLAKLDVRSV